jgi:hypothetical protein
MLSAGVSFPTPANPRMLPHMSTGIGAFEQVKWDLVTRGYINDFDLPALIIGVTTQVAKGEIEDETPKEEQQQSLPIISDIEELSTPPEPVRNRVTQLTAKKLEKVRETGYI